MADAGTTEETQPPSVEAIAAARAQIDAIDQRILGLLGERVACNVAIAAAKQAAGVMMPLRPAREVMMMRKLVAEAPPGVDAHLIVDVWRALIAANVQRQKPVDIAVGGAPDMVRHFDVARRHFGGMAKVFRTVDAREALMKVHDNPSTVAVLPWPGANGAAVWWPILAESRFHHLSIIAALPMKGEGEPPEAAVVANGATLEAAGSDHTFGLAFDPHYRSARALNVAQLHGKEAARVRETVLLEIEGFVPPGDGRLLAAAQGGLEGLRVIGSYARF